MSADALRRLVERVGKEGPPLKVRAPDPDRAAIFGDLAEAGPRTGTPSGEYAFVVEAVREGYLCHYGKPRVLDDPDPDLTLLAGDLFYAIGISGLTGLDDLESTGILSDLIRVAAELQAAGRPDLAETLWLGQVVAVACGKDARQRDAVKGLEAGAEGAAAALRSWSEETAAKQGLGRAFDTAQTAIDFGPSNL